MVDCCIGTIALKFLQGVVLTMIDTFYSFESYKYLRQAVTMHVLVCFHSMLLPCSYNCFLASKTLFFMESLEAKENSKVY